MTAADEHRRRPAPELAFRAIRDCRRWREHGRRDAEAGAARLSHRLPKLPMSASAAETEARFRKAMAMRASASDEFEHFSNPQILDDSARASRRAVGTRDMG